jgi:hypothetical protein
MKKLLALALSFASLAFTALPADAKATPSSISPTTAIVAQGIAPRWERQNRGRQDRFERHNSHGARTVIQTSYVRYGRRVFRETYLVRFLPFGRVETRLISRERVR